jgi:hypothetical protein
MESIRIGGGPMSVMRVQPEPSPTIPLLGHFAKLAEPRPSAKVVFPLSEIMLLVRPRRLRASTISISSAPACRSAMMVQATIRWRCAEYARSGAVQVVFHDVGGRLARQRSRCHRARRDYCLSLKENRPLPHDEVERVFAGLEVQRSECGHDGRY